MKRFKVEYKARHPQIVLVAIGMNDSTFDKTSKQCRVLVDDTKNNLQKIIDLVQENGSKVVLVGLTDIMEELLIPIPWNRNLFYYDKNVKKYDAVIREVAERNKIPYCKMQGLLKSKDLDDGLHPNAEGHRKMFERIKNFLEEQEIGTVLNSSF